MFDAKRREPGAHKLLNYWLESANWLDGNFSEAEHVGICSPAGGSRLRCCQSFAPRESIFHLLPSGRSFCSWKIHQSAERALFRWTRPAGGSANIFPAGRACFHTLECFAAGAGDGDSQSGRAGSVTHGFIIIYLHASRFLLGRIMDIFLASSRVLIIISRFCVFKRDS